MNNWVINTLINIILYYKNMYSSDDIIINNIKKSIKDVEKNIMYYVRKLFTKKFFLGIGSIGGFIYLLALLLNFLQGTI